MPLVTYEVCEWLYKHKVNSNSHIWWNKGQHSVPSRYIGPNTFEVIRRMFDEAKIEAQSTQTAKAKLAISHEFTPDILEKACEKSLKRYHMPFYKTIYSNAKSINAAKELNDFKESNSKSGIVRGADYYRKGD